MSIFTCNLLWDTEKEDFKGLFNSDIELKNIKYSLKDISLSLNQISIKYIIKKVITEILVYLLIKNLTTISFNSTILDTV